MKDQIVYKVLHLNLLLAIIALVIGVTTKFVAHMTIGSIILNIGIFLIIISPVLRVLLEMIFFIKDRNYTYIIICLILFIIITISIIS
jgi:uncharacterized membrane protein